MAEIAAAVPTDAERLFVETVIKQHEPDRPASVKRVEAEFSEDWTGNPAVYVNLVVSKDIDPTPDRVQELNEFVKAIHDDIIDRGFRFWPYSRTRTE